MHLSDYFYELPSQLIAQTPLADRSDSRLLVLAKENGSVLHKKFTDMLDYFNAGDCLVLNNTKVIPARLFGRREKGSLVEILLLKRLDGKLWEVIVRPGKKARQGDVLSFSDLLKGTITDVLETGNRIIEFEFEGIFEEILDKIGEMPLPPYITETLADKSRYQTVYAEIDGSAAAPTAGLHFTDSVLHAFKSKGVVIAEVTLHVGLGTFRPVKSANITEHLMHTESFFIDQKNCDLINLAKANGKKVCAVGTTSCRVLETAADEKGFLLPTSGSTEIFIYPPYKFKCLDALLTNFHLPESTLIMLISALAGRENVLAAYHQAVETEYRFFSFGDAMLII